ncbi:MAG: hypothetical protein V4538_17315 [Bacteroidota bacterium]
MLNKKRFIVFLLCGLFSVQIANCYSFSNIKNLLHGAWVREDYNNSLIEKKSPAYASNLLVEEVCLRIDSNHFRNDTLIMDVSFFNHEGGEYYLPFTDDNIFKIYKSQQIKSSRSLNLVIQDKDTIIIITKYSKNGEIVYSTKFIKVSNSLQSLEIDNIIDYVTNKIVIKGFYIWKDELNKTVSYKVEFDEYGNITGSNKFNKFHIRTDFVEYEKDDIKDVITFYLTKKKIRKNFTYKMQNNKILFYKIEEGKKQSLVFSLTPR